MEEILIGTSDRTILLFIPDPASTDGSGKSGLVAANLTVTYTRVETDNDVIRTDVTSSLNNLANLTAAHNDWGIYEVDAALCPGLYRLDVADAVFATGAWYAVVYVMITTSAAAATPKVFRLVAVDALDSVRMGLTALPNAAAGANNGLPIVSSGAITANISGNLLGNVTGNVTGNVNGSVDSVTQPVTVGGYTGSADTAMLALQTSINAVDDYIDTEVAAIKLTTDHLSTAMELDGAVYRFTTNALEQSPTGGSAPTAPEIVDEAWNFILDGGLSEPFAAGNVVYEILSGVSGILNFTDTEIAAIKLKTDLIPAAPAAVGSAMTLTSGERNSIATALLDLTDGVETGETLRQFCRLLRAVLVGVSDADDPDAGTIVFKRRDGTTTALTVVYNAEADRTSSTVGTV